MSDDNDDNSCDIDDPSRGLKIMTMIITKTLNKFKRKFVPGGGKTNSKENLSQAEEKQREAMKKEDDAKKADATVSQRNNMVKIN